MLPPAGGRPIRTVANGECLLHAFLASDPRYVRNSLPGLATDHPGAFQWLADTGGVRSSLRRRAEAYSHSGTLRRHAEADPVVAAMREFVMDYLVHATGAGRLPHEVIGQLRLSTTEEFGARLQKMSRDQLVALAQWHGVDVSAGPDGLSDADLRKRLEFAYATSPAPLTTDELAGLLNAVQNWARSWDSAYGEVFPPLTAHAFGVRIDVAQTFASGQRRVLSSIGPQTGAAGANVEIYYNGVNHYDGSDAVTDGTGARARGFQRTGTRTAVLDGATFTLHAAAEDDADTLLSALRHAAPASLTDAGIDTADALRERLVRGVGAGEVPAVLVPPPTGGRSLPVPRLEELGVLLDNSQRTQGILLGGDLPLTDLTPAQHLQVLLGDPAYTDANTRMSALLAIAVHLFGGKVAVMDSDGTVTLLGDPANASDSANATESTESAGPSGSAPPVLLVLDGDGAGHLVGRPDEQPTNNST